MHGSVVGVGRVISGLNQSEERMTIRRVETEVTDQTWEYQLGQIVIGDRVLTPIQDDAQMRKEEVQIKSQSQTLLKVTADHIPNP